MLLSGPGADGLSAGRACPLPANPSPDQARTASARQAAPLAQNPRPDGRSPSLEAPAGRGARGGRQPPPARTRASGSGPPRSRGLTVSSRLRAGGGSRKTADRDRPSPPPSRLNHSRSQRRRTAGPVHAARDDGSGMLDCCSWRSPPRPRLVTSDDPFPRRGACSASGPEPRVGVRLRRTAARSRSERRRGRTRRRVRDPSTPAKHPRSVLREARDRHLPQQRRTARSLRDGGRPPLP
jgi:hypothetical protein